MRIVTACLGACLLLVADMANAMPLNSSARSVIPSDLQQLISADYRELRNSPTAMQLKQQLLPDNLKEFETALKGIGIDPDKDIDTLTFAAFRTEKQGVKQVGVASGPFAMKTVLKKLALHKITPTKYRLSKIYPMEGGMVMVFLDDSTLLFGEISAVKVALDTRDGQILSVDANATMADLMANVDSSPVWSILDQQGTQAAVRSALGDAAKIGDYESVKKRLLGSSYTMSFSSGVNFDATVVTADSMSAATLSSLLKGFALYEKLSGGPIEKKAMEGAVIDSDASNVQVHFKAGDQDFQSLMHTKLFAALSH